MNILKPKENGQFTMEISSDFKVFFFSSEYSKTWILTHVKDTCYAFMLTYKTLFHHLVTY